MLVDSVKIEVRGGTGGNGCVSFRREKYVPKGGPDGGNGGTGGSVYVVGQNNTYLLKRFRERPLIEGENGKPGGPNKRQGADGGETVIKVPFGTRITNLKDQSAFEILEASAHYQLARGGRGGRGNWEFRSPTNQTPRTAESGRCGSVHHYQLDLMLIADIGLIGLPNAGKSTLLNALTQAHAKTADYPFTTLEPNLAMLGNLVVADIPGLIEGASRGRGLGSQFLRHVERTRLLVHCLSCESADPKHDYQIIRRELAEYSPQLAEQSEIIVFTKYDVLADKSSFIKKVSSLVRAPLLVSVLDDKSIKALAKKLIYWQPPKSSNTHKKPAVQKPADTPAKG